MNSTTTTPATLPTLRQLAAAAYQEKIERDAKEREDARRTFRHQQMETFGKLVASRITRGTGTDPFTMEWNETDETPSVEIDGLKFVPSFDDQDDYHSITGVALQTPDGRRHRIESLADLGALLQDQEIALDNAVWNLQHPEAPHNAPTLAPPMSETHPEVIPSIYICTSGGVAEVVSSSHPIKVYHFDHDEAESDDDYNGEEYTTEPNEIPSNEPRINFEFAVKGQNDRRG